jgi:hypothetical protein
LEHTVTPVWAQPFKLSHWIRHATVPVLLLLGLLTLPHPWEHPQWLPEAVITVQLQAAAELVEPQQATPVQPPEPVPTEPEPIETIETVEPAEPSPTAPPLPQPASMPEEPTAVVEPAQAQQAAPPAQTATRSLSAGDIMLMAKSRTSIEITQEFTARSPTAQNFYIPEQEIRNWLDDIPYLDESVDRPTIEMRFYAEGLEGHIEKFFDKITISKTFTTKYGTKIHCALIGVIAACSWK